MLEDVFRKIKWRKKCGVNINGRRLTNLRFADDIILFAKSARELQEMLQELHTKSKEIGLTMNADKTKVMTNALEIPIKVDTTEIEYTNEYIYLGQLVTFRQNTEKEINRRITAAWKAFWSLKFILLEKSISRKLRFEVLESCIFPILLYGCQTWSLVEKLKKTIQIVQRKMQRKILGISLRDRISNDTLRSLSSDADALERAMKLKWKWGGHVARLQPERWAHAATIWDPYTGKRGRGRPRRRWADMFIAGAGKQWSRLARDRKKWKELEKSYLLEQK